MKRNKLPLTAVKGDQAPLLTMKFQEFRGRMSRMHATSYGVPYLLALWGLYTLEVLFWPTAASRVVVSARILLYV